MNSLIVTPTPDLKQSVDFYHSLGFRTVPDPDRILLTDGKVLMEVDPHKFTRAGIRLFAGDWKDKLEEVEVHAVITRTPTCYLLSDPSGVWIYLMEEEFNPAFEVQQVPFGVLGNYAGLSLETTDMARSLKLWKTLGFSQVQGSFEDGWISCMNGDGMGISLMKPNTCPHLFFNPSLTYFNSGKNPEVIAQIRELGVPISEEITVFNKNGEVDNIIIRDPGGFGFFVFND